MNPLGHKNWNRTISWVVSGVRDFRKSGSGTLTLSAVNTYTGTTHVAGGKLSVATIGNGGVSGNLGAATSAASNLVLGGGTLLYTGVTSTTNRGLTLAAATTSTLENNDGLAFAKVLSINGGITGSGNIIYRGYWKFDNGSNTYTGTTELIDCYAGMNAGGSAHFGTGDLTLSGNSTLSVNVALTVPNNIVANSTYAAEGEGVVAVYIRQGSVLSGTFTSSLTDQGIAAYAGSGVAPNVTGVISGAFNLHINNSPGSTAIDITLSGNNTYTGKTIVHRATCSQTGTVAHSGVDCYFSGTGSNKQTTGKYVYPASPDLSAQTINIIASGVTTNIFPVVLVSWASGTATGTPVIQYNGVTQAFGVPFADGARTINLTYSTTTGIAITAV